MASSNAKRAIWRVEADRYILTRPDLHEFGRQLGDYYEGKDPDRMGYRVVEKLRNETREKFESLDLFFVKVSTALGSVPRAPR